MTNIIKRMMRVVRKSLSNGKKLVNKKQVNCNDRKHKQHRGGAVYSFDLTDKIGGLPANVSLNGTDDGDCPRGNISDLGISNYAVSGGKRNSHTKKRRSSKKQKHHSSKKNHTLKKKKNHTSKKKKNHTSKKH